MTRLPQVVMIVSFLALSWLSMMVFHELGHVMGASVTGGRVSRVVLHPLRISRTDLSHNPHPLAVTWAGPLVGVILPAAAWGVAAIPPVVDSRLFRFSAGFCLVANGAYLGVGSFEGVGDAGDLLRHGAAMWQLWAFGAITVPLGFFSWHKTGESFGLGDRSGRVSLVSMSVTLVLLGLLVAGELMLAGELAFAPK